MSLFLILCHVITGVALVFSCLNVAKSYGEIGELSYLEAVCLAIVFIAIAFTLPDLFLYRGR